MTLQNSPRALLVKLEWKTPTLMETVHKQKMQKQMLNKSMRLKVEYSEMGVMAGDLPKWQLMWLWCQLPFLANREVGRKVNEDVAVASPSIES